VIDTNKNDPIAMVAFGDVYDMNDGKYNQETYGDTWSSTWLSNGDVYLTWNDGTGFHNKNEKDGMLSGLAKLNGNPNYDTTNFDGQNLNPGTLGNSRNGFFRYDTNEYNQGVIEHEGVLYYALIGGAGTLIYSYDGGINWFNIYGQKNVKSVLNDYTYELTRGHISGDIRFGRGNALPKGLPSDMEAEKYIYFSIDFGYLAKVERAKFARLNREDWQYLTGLDSENRPLWSYNAFEMNYIPGIYTMFGIRFSPKDVARPTSSGFMTYNEQMKKFIQISWSNYYPLDEEPDYWDWTSGYTRYHLHTADYPWGPFTEAGNHALRGSTCVAPILLTNKYTSGDGKKMWMAIPGGLPFWTGWKKDHSPWIYGFQYMPVYLAKGMAVVYDAYDADLNGNSWKKSNAEADVYPKSSGLGYAGGLICESDSITFNIAHKIPEKNWYIINVAYTNPNNHCNTVSVYINGRKARTLILSKNDKDSPNPDHEWANHTAVYRLEKGVNNRFEIKCDSDIGDNGKGVLIDSITVSCETTYNEGENIAPTATITQSSGNGYNAVKGYVDYATEWKANEKNGAYLHLEWTTPQTINKVILYDQYTKNGGEGIEVAGAGNGAVINTNRGDQVISGTLSFSDGSTVKTGKLQNDGIAGGVVAFPVKKIEWLRFTIDEVGIDTVNAGLGEIMVMYDQNIEPEIPFETDNNKHVLKFTNTDGDIINLVFDSKISFIDSNDIKINPVDRGKIMTGVLKVKPTGSGVLPTGISWDTEGMIWSLSLDEIITPGDFTVTVNGIEGSSILTVRNPSEYVMRKLVQDANLVKYILSKNDEPDLHAAYEHAVETIKRCSDAADKSYNTIKHAYMRISDVMNSI